MTSQLLSGLVICTGMLLLGGITAVAYGLTRPQPRLADGLAMLDPTATEERRSDDPSLEATSISERAGMWLYRHSPVPLFASQRRLLELRNKSVAEFFADKLILGILGLVVPGLLGAMFLPLIGFPLPVPVLASLIGLVIGYFLPDLILRRDGGQAQNDALEALFTYFDLVTLERMANLSGAQALDAAAGTSNNPLFLSIRTALLRARMEQRPPYAELRALAERLRVPQLADIADVMQLEESGAAVSDTLRARVRELRDAHLTATQMAAHEVSERMTVFMAAPAMVFGLIFLVPPLLRLVGSDG